ncbi:hypothetical protein WJX74_008883 [Apatococcus lobatus]|uniref:Uncharacterized protein n=1 Tax=Apatococcus lobatus TaxID=904363 RepID=A0AAW1RG20_9CHLO
MVFQFHLLLAEAFGKYRNEAGSGVANLLSTGRVAADKPGGIERFQQHAIKDVLSAGFMMNMRNIDWYLVQSPGANVEGDPQTFPGPEDASPDAIRAQVAERAHLSPTSTVLIHVACRWRDLRDLTSLPNGDLELKIVDQPAGAQISKAGATAGGEQRLPAEKVTSVSIARRWAPVSEQLDGALYEQLVDTDEFIWVEEFGHFWKEEEQNLAQVQLNLLPCIREPSESYAHGRELVQHIVRRMPGYVAKAPAMPTVSIFCNETVLSESETERKARPDLAYCGFEKEVDSKDQYKHVRLIAEYKPFSSYSEGEYEDEVGEIIRRCRCALNVGRDPFVLPALVTDNRYIRAYLVRDSKDAKLQHIWKAKRLPLCVERGTAHPSAPLPLDTSSAGFKELAFLLWLSEALRLRAEAEHQDLWLRPGQQVHVKSSQGRQSASFQIEAVLQQRTCFSAT